MFKRKKPVTTTVHTPRSRKALEGDNPLARRLRAEDEPATIDLESGEGFGDTANPPPAEPPTRQLDENQLSPADQADNASRVAGETAPCGILLVLAGPYRGDIVALHYGENRVFQDSSSGFSVTRDTQTGAEPLVELHYDPASRQFTLYPGSSGHRVSIDGDEVEAPRVINHGQQIAIGSEGLRLVAICDSSFTW